MMRCRGTPLSMFSRNLVFNGYDHRLPQSSCVAAATVVFWAAGALELPQPSSTIVAGVARVGGAEAGASAGVAPLRVPHPSLCIGADADANADADADAGTVASTPQPSPAPPEPPPPPSPPSSSANNACSTSCVPPSPILDADEVRLGEPRGLSNNPSMSLLRLPTLLLRRSRAGLASTSAATGGAAQACSAAKPEPATWCSCVTFACIECAYNNNNNKDDESAHYTLLPSSGPPYHVTGRS